MNRYSGTQCANFLEKIGHIVFLLLVMLHSNNAAKDYCSLCKNHIACNNTGVCIQCFIVCEVCKKFVINWFSIF